MCISHARCWFFFGDSHCCSLNLICSRFEVGVDRVPQKSFSFVGCVSAVHQISSTGIGTSGREDRDPPEGGDDGRGTEVTVERVAWPWRKFILELVVREDALPEISFVMMLVRWMMWRLCCRRQRPISNSRNPQAGELLTGGRLVVNFHDDPGWDHSRLFLWPLMRTLGSSSLLTVTNMRRKFPITRRCGCHPLLVKVKHPRLAPLILSWLESQ